ncbi:AAA family ATPase [Mycobacterium sp. 21AC1]|uniref:AAA family ATPase n=1 Tax=[Mycobacterium] appelbergii TaxID=2939269 RepID=UPI0029394EAB|nr:AAA family ATPase [Mycobacterium sp. 21AC1]MDV3124673.1 AAA family ATPase [Mycobacterium sp. 21AC1]
MSNDIKNDGTRADSLTALLAGAPEATDHDGVRAYLHALAEASCAPLLVYPNSKLPADGRASRTRFAADAAAQAAAKDAGKRNWHKVKSPAGVHLATANTSVLDGYLDEYIRLFGEQYPDEGVPVNVAVSTGRSGLVVVDCDTAEQLAAFLADVGAPQDAEPTVRSPGQANADGEMVHKDGGHFWFVVPDGVALPDNLGAITDPAGGYAILWGAGRYVLTPPSVRPEGSYAAVGEVHELPTGLRDRITAEGEKRAQRPAQRQEHASQSGDGITTWGATVTWADILDGTDWINTGKAHNCGCDIWTAPGLHASEKSATAHEPGCAWSDSPDPPLHFWTDHDVAPFDAYLVNGTKTVSRLQAVAAIYFNNDLGAAMTAMDLHPTTPGFGFGAEFGATDDAAGSEGADADQPHAGGRALRITWACEIEPEPVVWLWVDISTRNSAGLAPEGTSAPDPFSIEDIACVAPGHPWSPPEVETDGRIACGMVSIAAGREGSGKSSFGIWLAAKITRGTLPGAHYGVPKRVYYLATEDSWKHTLVPRLMAAGADLTKIARVEVAVTEHSTVTLSLPDDVDLLTQSIKDNDVALIVIDPLMSTMGAGLDTNGTRDVRTALEPLAAMADQTGAAVVAIAHFNKATGLDSLTRISGSGAFKDVARAVMVFANGEDDERVFTEPKNSVGRTDLPSLVYKITGAVVDTPKGKTSTGKFTFTGVAERSVDDMLAEQRGGGHRSSPVREFLVDYITEHADEKTGEVDAAEVIAAAEGEGFTARQITDARGRCTDPKISTRSEGYGKDKRHIWKAERRRSR